MGRIYRPRRRALRMPRLTRRFIGRATVYAAELAVLCITAAVIGHHVARAAA